MNCSILASIALLAAAIAKEIMLSTVSAPVHALVAAAASIGSVLPRLVYGGQEPEA